MEAEPIRLQGDGALGFKVGLAMLAPAVPAYLVFGWLGERSFVGLMSACFGMVLAALSPIPLLVGWRFFQQRIELAGGRLRVEGSGRPFDVAVEELEGVRLVDGEGGWARLAFHARGEWLTVDPRAFARDQVSHLVEALRTARPGLPG